MDDDGDLLTIGQLAKRTGLSVKTLRYWSDEGLVPPAGRTHAGYRMYGADALPRLALVRTLRDLGVDLRTVQRVLERELTVTDVAKTHAEALGTHIRTLRLHLTVLRAVAERGSDAREMEIMNKLAQMSAEQRRGLMQDFLDDTLGDADGPVEQRMRQAMPDLPDEPSQAQVEAWIELADLVQDPAYRASVRTMVARAAEMRERGEGMPSEQAQAATRVVAERAGQALADGVAPDGDTAAPLVAELAAGYAEGEGDDPTSSRWRLELADRLDEFTDRRAERYWQLLAVVNGWGDCVPTTVPAMEWFIAGLRAHA